MDNKYWVKVHEYIHNRKAQDSNPKPRTWKEVEDLLNKRHNENE